MPIVGIREISVEDSWDPSDDTIGESFTIQSKTTETREREFSGWQFEDQDITSIEFEYIPSSGFGSVQPTTGKIEIRPSSGLLFVISDSGTKEVDQVIRDLRKSVDENLAINKRLVLNRQVIWQFVLAGNPQRIDVVTPFGGVQRIALVEDPHSSVDFEDAKGNYPVDSAKIEFTHESEPFDVRYLDDKLDIESDLSGDVEFIIQTFESAVR
ncbi:hypothetical protein [Halorubrum sp. PV6]|uniref:hypothetical protein n=1 Tax=Halorubrum sp. PV6 TaxID=634157 RepID=UPI000F8F54E7|nr:hypothetical protein [Halorubrum sp. PV6]